MTTLAFDIETLPATDPTLVQEIKANLQAPANYKNPEAIEKWKQENAEEAVLKTSFDGCFGRMFCVGFKINDEAADVFGGDNEVKNLKDFAHLIGQFKPHELQMIKLIGHNIIGFDMRFLFQRYVINGVKPPALPWKAKPWDDRIHDNMLAFAGDRGSISQDKLAKALGLPGKKGMSGAEVYPAWQRGEHQKIMDYCKDDVEQSYQIYQRLNFITA